MDIVQRLEVALQHHNALLVREQQLEQERLAIHDQRIEALGRVKVLQELRSEEMGAQAKAAEGNGNIDDNKTDDIRKIAEETTQNE